MNNVLPHNEDCERDTIGLVYLDTSGEYLDAVKRCLHDGAAEFFNPTYASLYGAALSAQKAGEPISFTFARDFLQGELDGRKVFDSLKAAMESAPTVTGPEMVGRWAERVHELHTRRQAIGAAERLAIAARAGNGGSIAEVKAAVDALANGQPGDRITRQSVADLIAENPTLAEPLIDGVIRRADVGQVVSHSKAGKSALMLDMGLAVATGCAWMQTFPTKPGRVLLLDCELKRDALAHRIRRMLESRKLAPSDVADSFHVESLRGRPTDIFKLERYFARIKPGEFDLIILDPLYSLYGPNVEENSPSDLIAVYAALSAYAEMTGAAIFTSHHAPKGNVSARSVIDVGAGGGTSGRSVDAMIVLRRHKEADAAVVESVLRNFAPFPPFVARFNFPQWIPAPDLNPLDLERPGRRQAALDEPPNREWTAAMFADSFAAPEPRFQAGIIAAARKSGMLKSEANRLFAEAVDAGLIIRHKPRNPAEKITFTLRGVCLDSSN